MAFALEEAEDNRILRSSLWFAVGIHIVLLLINFPNFTHETIAAPEEPEILRLVPTPIFKPPVVPKATIPPKRVKRIPMPDPTPHEPEPIPIEEPRPVVNLPEIDEDYFEIPEAPPAPPPDKPLIVGGEVSRPVKIHAPQPSYTEIARKARIQGEVRVQSIIDRNGDVGNIEVLKGLPMGLTEAAVDAIRQWKFKPATLRGKPVDVYYRLTVTFSLQ